MSATFETGQVICTGVDNAVPLTTKQLECVNLIVKPNGTVGLGNSAVTQSTGVLLDAGETFSHDNTQEQGQRRFDLQPHQVYVAGAAGVVVSWVATGTIG
ncbi:MAG: hypothetical protein ACXVGB_00600 [Mycobacteriaceae bacterium]